MLFHSFYFSNTCIVCKRAESITGDQHELTSLIRHIMNRCTTQRTISKQECMVLVSGMPLVQCSENIQTVSISDSKRLSKKSKKKNGMSAYLERLVEEDDLSFAEFLEQNIEKDTEKKIIPHYVGLNSRPAFPPTVDYARATLIIHKPWRRQNCPHLLVRHEVMSQFYNFIKSKSCPMAVTMSYKRVKTRYESGQQYAECTNDDEKFNEPTMNEDDEKFLDVMNSLTGSLNPTLDIQGIILNRGITFDWGKKIIQVSVYKYIYS